MKGAAALVGTVLRAVRERTETMQTKGRLGGTWPLIVDTFRPLIVDSFLADAVETNWKERGAPRVYRGVLGTTDEFC